MKRVAYRYLVAAVLALASMSAVPTYAKGWEPLKTEHADAKQVVKETELEIKADSNTIIVTANHPIQIKIFTILGRLVSAETAPAGTSQFTLPAHGIYIVKTGSLTCKVAV